MTATRRRSRGAIALVVLVLVFAFALPRIADYGDAWEAVAAMTAGQVLLLGAVCAWNLFSYWPVLVLAQPGLRLREAAVVNQASTAVANTVPAGSALAVGVTFRMLRDWGFTSESITNQVLVTGVWNQLVKLGLPVVAVAAVAATGEVEGSALRLAAWGVGAILVVVAVGAVVLRAPAATERLGAGLDRLATAALGRLGRPRPTRIGPWLTGTRAQLADLVHHRAVALSAASVVSHLSLYLVLLVALRAVGVPADELGWAQVLLGFSVVRLLSAVPVTPGGVGLVELGYVGFFTLGAAAAQDGPVAAGVLVFRAVTYALPIVLGAGAWLVHQRADGWRRPPNSRGTRGLGRTAVAA